jgi:hypothetical protein
MQTFLPYPDYLRSAEVLDRQRLGKQRVEVVQILNALHEITDGWRNHPATRMWRGHEPQLAEYGLAICEEWIGRGYQDTCKPKIEQHLEWATSGEFTLTKPLWFGDPAFHLAHQSNLLRKDPKHYGQYFPDVPTDLEYIWPVD